MSIHVPTTHFRVGRQKNRVRERVRLGVRLDVRLGVRWGPVVSGSMPRRGPHRQCRAEIQTVLGMYTWVSEKSGYTRPELVWRRAQNQKDTRISEISGYILGLFFDGHVFTRNTGTVGLAGYFDASAQMAVRRC